ncbi:unnamed protein product [Linum trigynum]|uniref:RING-type domain-containing protein n=1 Tax=Linum trigynum TaxID=586398 RepID=A0AAV2C5T8_9ROSI
MARFFVEQGVESSRGDQVAVIVGVLITVLGILYGAYRCFVWVRSTCFSGAPTQQLPPAAPELEMEPVSAVVQPVSPDTLAALPVREFSPDCGEQITDCGICLEQYTVGDRFWELPCCSHHFHVACVGMWFQGQQTCPFCHRTVRADEHGIGGNKLSGINVMKVWIFLMPMSETR